MPSIPGMRMSLMITSGCSRDRRCNIASPLSKVIVVIPACSSARSSTHRIERSSSMTHTLLLLLAMRLLQRQIDAEDGRAWFRFALDQTAVLAHDALRDGQPQTGAVGAPADHRVVHAIEEVGWNAGTVVGDVEAQHLTVAGGADRELADDPARQTNHRRRCFLQCLLRVADDVQQRLNQ